MLDSRGKSANAVLAASTSTAKVAYCSAKYSAPPPKMCRLSCDSTVSRRRRHHADSAARASSCRGRRSRGWRPSSRASWRRSSSSGRECAHAVRDRFRSRHGDAAFGERAQHEEDEREAGDRRKLAPCCRAERSRRASGPAPARLESAERPHEPIAISASIITMKTYVGMLNTAPDSRTPRRLTSISSAIDATQSSTVCAREPRIRRRDGRDAAGDRHGDGEDVVGEQRRGGNEAGHRAEVVLRDRVRAAAVRIGEDRLPVASVRRARAARR